MKKLKEKPNYNIVEWLRYKQTKTNFGLGWLLIKARKLVNADRSLYRSRLTKDTKATKRKRKYYYRQNKALCLLRSKIWRINNLEHDRFIKKKAAYKKKIKAAMKEVYKHTRRKNACVKKINQLQNII